MRQRHRPHHYARRTRWPTRVEAERRRAVDRAAVTSEAAFPGYALALWGLPDDYEPAGWRIETNADRHLLARNTNGEHHLVLLFDLDEGDQAVTVRLMR